MDEFSHSILVTDLSTPPLSGVENVKALGVNGTNRKSVVRVKSSASKAGDCRLWRRKGCRNV